MGNFSSKTPRYRELRPFPAGKVSVGCAVASTKDNGDANAKYGYTYTAGWGETGNETCACCGDAPDCVIGAGKGYAL